MSIKAILFDMDGVLIDSETYYCQGTIDWMIKNGYQGNIDAIYTILGTTMEVTYQILQELFENKYTIEELTEINETYFKENPLPYSKILMPGVKELIAFLKENNIKMAVCSSSPMDVIEKCLTECGILESFDYIVSGEQFEKSKPDPEIYLHARDVFQLTSDECIVIEDSKLGIDAAVNAKMKVIALHNPKFKQDQSKATWHIENMLQAIDVVKQAMND